MSAFTTEKRLIACFYRGSEYERGNHWLLRANTPIPEEIYVEGPNEEDHVFIRPAPDVAVTPRIFKQVHTL